MRISISEHVYNTLSADSAISKLVGKNIYPIATKSEVKFPFIVYERETVSTFYDKRGAATANIDVSIYVLSESYSESEHLAELVISDLDRKNAEYEGYEVIDAILSDATESYISQTFVQQIRMRFTIREK